MTNNKFTNTVYTLQSFLEVDVAVWGNRLKEHQLVCMNDPAGYSQRKAWFDCFNILQQQFSLLELSEELMQNTFVVFEYELPRERGRRPDVLVLSGENLMVLEFKGYEKENAAQIDQAKHYARDLKNYHFKSHNLNVIPVLVLAKANEINTIIEEVKIVSGNNLHEIIAPFIKEKFIAINEWFNSEYAPLPSLIQSAQLLFKENKFPNIKIAQSAGIPIVLEKLAEIASESADTNTHHLALITGVPGAGKTLVGLQFVFDKIKQDRQQKAVFLSGNGPLIEVLQFSLQNKNFIQSVHGFLKQYAESYQLPTEDILIYDEAQRAWDAEKVIASNRTGTNAEPTDFINIGNRKKHILIIGLIGEGQEIYIGEESGMNLWTEAINQSLTKWTIHCPEKLSNYFNAQNIKVTPEFNLTKSLRTHQALSLQLWVKYLLDSEIEKAKEISTKLYEENYSIYITRDINIAKKYVHQKYENEPAKTFGLLASSKNKILHKYGIKNDFNSTKEFSIAQYYVDDKHEAYCGNLNTTVTEFGCQGLELDMPILAWETDFIYENNWQDITPNKKAKNSFNLRKNSYRVLLTRGRDGLIIFVPNDNLLNSTFQVLKAAGCRYL